MDYLLTDGPLVNPEFRLVPEQSSKVTVPQSEVNPPTKSNIATTLAS
jgi:hypothetical protein